jgi:hypothetical protein
MYIFQSSKQVEQVMIHRLAIYVLKQEVNNQRKHRALTGNKKEEVHNPSPMKNTQRKTTAHSHPGPKQQMGNTSDNRPNGVLSKM